MSLSRSPIMQRAGSPKSAVDWRRFSSQRMLSLSSIGTRVGLIFFLRAPVPLNLSRIQNLTAARPKGRPAGPVVTLTDAREDERPLFLDFFAESGVTGAATVLAEIVESGFDRGLVAAVHRHEKRVGLASRGFLGVVKFVPI